MIASQTIVTIKKGTGSYRPTPEVTVISDELIRQAVRKYYEENKEEYKISNLDTLPFNELRVLNLSFQEIYKIQNLDGLDRLEELRLDNNKIKKIENIEHLVHLKWLDLSFNAIEKIEGLNKLTKLTDLSLYSNQIKEVEGLDNCTELNVLSLGNNLIDKLEKMLDYLEKFRKLEVFNVGGNPLTKREQDYELNIILRLRYLKYLNYSFIDETMKKKIDEKDDLKSLKNMKQQDWKVLEEKDKIDQEKQDLVRKLKDARIDTIDNFIPEILSEPDYEERIKLIRGTENEVQKFIIKFNENAEVLKQQILQKNEVKLEQIKKFTSELEQRIIENEEETKTKIKNFEKKMKHIFRKFENPDYYNEEELNQLLADTETLENELIDIEMEFVEMEENGIKDFGFKLEEYMKDMNKVVADIFEKLRNDARTLKDNLNKITEDEIKKYTDYANMENPPEKEYNEDEEFFFENPEGVTNIVSQFGENVENKVLKKDNDINEGMVKFNKDFLENLREKQYERNRRNVNNIVNLIYKLREQIQKQLNPENKDDTFSNR